MKILQGIKMTNNIMQHNAIVYFHIWKKRNFHTLSQLLTQTKFEEKPLYIKKLKLKQAEFQKDDGLPVFLKGGVKDKILFNVTVGAVVLGLAYGIMVLVSIG